MFLDPGLPPLSAAGLRRILFRGALYKKEDNGLVLLESEKCCGCRPCLEACPYGALQHHREKEKAGKCDSCTELLEQGEKPACVSACPLRVLDFGELASLGETCPQAIPYEQFEPNAGKTLPCLLVKPHQGVRNGAKGPQPAVLSLAIAEYMRGKKWIKSGDKTLEQLNK
ncbi:MAG: 4Fe-4S dicluster domain-containing protein [Bacillota bacterium]